MALRKRYDVRDNDIEKLVPVLAATRLYERALDVPKLSPGNGIERSVIKLARKHNVPIRKTEVKIEGVFAGITRLYVSEGREVS